MHRFVNNSQISIISAQFIYFTTKLTGSLFTFYKEIPYNICRHGALLRKNLLSMEQCAAIKKKKL